MTSEELKRKSARLPKTPGVYVFRGAYKKVLYIGKAANLKSRVSSYAKTQDDRLKRMIARARTITSIPTESDIEALIMESTLIKKLKPAFNIVLRDDKQYFYVAITDETYPRVFLTHQPQKMQNVKIKNQNNNSKSKNLEAKSPKPESEFIGPFTEGAPLKTTLRALRSLFPYCTCTQNHLLPCLNAHIGRCMGFCCLREAMSHEFRANSSFKITKAGRARYQKNIMMIRDLLTGKRSSVIRRLMKEMKDRAARGELERAQKLQRTIRSIERVFQNARIVQESRTLNLESRDSLKQLQETLKLSKLPTRIEGYDISNIQGTSAVGSMVVFTDGVAHKDAYRKFKIRTVQGADLPRRTSGKAGDTGMLQEMLTRRFRHPEWQFPDLILVDGGKGQVNAAYAALSDKRPSFAKATAGKQVTLLRHLLRTRLRKVKEGYGGQARDKIIIVGLVKDEHHTGRALIRKSGTKYIITSLEKLPHEVRDLMLEIDAEAHRFAISYYRKLHRRTLTGGK